MKRLLSFLLAALMGVSLTAAAFAADEAGGEAERRGFYAIDPADGVIRSKDPKAGEGCVICVIDTGYDLDHPAFTPVKDAVRKITREDVAERIGETSVARRARQSGTDGWVSDKVIFAYDYFDDDFDVSCSEDVTHGTHVAATAAGSTEGGYDLAGVAPGAQLILMKVFPDEEETGYGLSKKIARAIRDAAILGADMISMSFGLGSGADEVVEAVNEVTKRGCICFAAAGNAFTTGYGYSYRDGLMITSNPEYGTLEVPGLLDNVITVGAVQNAVKYALTLVTGDMQFRYIDSADTDPIADVFGGETLDAVIVPGIGLEEDYEGVDVKGKLAVITRGEITFAEKALRAEAHGAAAVLFLNHNPDDDISRTTVKSDDGIPSIPVISMSSYLEAEQFREAFDGKITIVGDVSQPFENNDANMPAEFSSFGTDPKAAIKPDVSFVGTYVVSAKYAGWSKDSNGTSMSCPQAAGLAAVMLNEFPGRFDGLKGVERTEEMRLLLASLCRPARNSAGYLYSPRQQGAGYVNAQSDLVPHSVIWTGRDVRMPGAMLGDKLATSFRFDFTAQNPTGGTVTWRPSAEVTTDGYVLAEDGAYLNTGTPVFVPATVDFFSVASGKRVEAFTLAAGEKIELTVQVTLDKDWVAKRQEKFPYGMFIDGYVFMSEAETLEYEGVLPFSGFCGDWTAAPAVDGIDADGEETYWGTNYVVTVNDGDVETLGYSTFADMAISRLFAISPDGDSRGSFAALLLAPLRAIDKAKVEVFNARGELVCESTDGSFDASTWDADNENVYYDYLILWDGSDGINPDFAWDDGDYKIRITFEKSAGGTQTLELPMIIDTVYPTVGVVSEDDGSVTFTARDDRSVRRFFAVLPNPYYDPDDPEGTEEPAYYFAEDSEGIGQITVPAEYAAELPHLYVVAEDFASNRTIYRWHP